MSVFFQENHKNSRNAEVYAKKFSVSPAIHSKDYIFEYKIDKNLSPDHQQRDDNETCTYFEDGAYSCSTLMKFLEKYKVFPKGRPLELLEFASGYGCVSRHIAKNKDIHLTSCDIHKDAVDFIQSVLGTDAVLSSSLPEDLKIDKKFDVIFALSFFSHMPDETFGRWLKALYSLLKPGGYFIFTTHGVDAYNAVGRPPAVGDNWTVSPSGCWFYQGSEQKDLPAAEYGISLVPFDYVMRKLNNLECGQLVHFEKGLWWHGGQDVFIVQSDDVAFHAPRPEQVVASKNVQIERVLTDIETLKNSTSWRLTAPLRVLSRKLRR